MKKTGKYERKPKAGDLLLRTYLTSMVSLILCVSMFLGTSYAWFTSEVTNTQNEIYVGTLKVGLYKGKECTAENNLATKEGLKLFSNQIRWEPGYTALETITVKNEGDLAFHYVMNFIEAAESNNEATENDGAETEATENTATEKNTTEQVDLEAVAKMFEVYVFNHRANTYKTPNSYGDITAYGSGWTEIGTLAEVLDGKVVLEGNMVSVREEGQEEAVINEGTTDGLATLDTYTIALHMKESATAKVMGQRISLNVKLLAYQHSSENDVFGNPNYDKVTTVTNADELREAFKNGGIISLAEDIVAENIPTLGAIYDNKSVDIYLNGHDITATLAEDEKCNSTELFYVGKGCKLTIHGDDSSEIHVNAAQGKKTSAVITNYGDVTINGTGEIALNFNGTVDAGRAVNTISNYGTLTVNGGKISNTGVGNQIGYGIDNYGGATLMVNGGEITVFGSSYYDGIRLFCGNQDNVVTINGGTISTIWAQNPSDGKAAEVKGTVIVNGGTIDKVYYENYTTVQVKKGVAVTVESYGAGKDNYTISDKIEDGYSVYSFVNSNS